MLAAALRASSLDACDEVSEAARRAPQDELPGCRLDHGTSGPLTSEAVEVRAPQGVHSEPGGPGAVRGAAVVLVTAQLPCPVCRWLSPSPFCIK